MGEGGQIWLKCITGDLIMVIRDKNNIFERVENFHADLAWNYPAVRCSSQLLGKCNSTLVYALGDVVQVGQAGRVTNELRPGRTTDRPAMQLLTI